MSENALRKLLSISLVAAVGLVVAVESRADDMPFAVVAAGDGYWDDRFYRHWKMVRLADNAVKDIGDFYVPEAYRDVYCRCDLHPRWRPDGRQIAFNSVHEGSRQIYVMDVAENSRAKPSM